MSLHGFSYTKCDFATNKTGKEIPSITTTLNCQCDWQIFALIQNGDTKITDWITSQKPIPRRHPINLNNNITDISQKKDLPTSANDTNIYRLSLWYNNNERLKLPSHTVTLHSAIRQPYTRCTRKLLNDIQHSHPISQSCLLKGKKHNASEFKS